MRLIVVYLALISLAANNETYLKREIDILALLKKLDLNKEKCPI